MPPSPTRSSWTPCPLPRWFRMSVDESSGVTAPHSGQVRAATKKVSAISCRDRDHEQAPAANHDGEPVAVLERESLRVRQTVLGGRRRELRRYHDRRDRP